jgi:hypothetical protein
MIDYEKKYLKYKKKYTHMKYGGNKIQLFHKTKIFITNLFNTLKYYNVCFLSGTFIFEDHNNRLFNFLTYGKDINSNVCFNDSQTASVHWTLTHKTIFNNEKVVSNEQCNNSPNYVNVFCPKNKCLKYEIVLDEQLEYLCDKLNPNPNSIDINNKVPKRILLYYKFQFNNKNYLFFKLESHSMNTVNHLFNFLNKEIPL